jgi:hypothetical protein
MSPVTESDISRSFQAVWTSVFGRPLPSAPARPAAAPSGRAIVARVRISGEVEQSVVVVCSIEQARRLTAGFFGIDPASVEESLIRDVFGEVANMVGGLVKRHFPTPCRLSLPDVREVRTDEPETGPSVQVLFACGDTPLAVRLVQNLS